MPQIEPKDLALKSLKGTHLWHAPMSSCSQRVRIVLAETNRGFESHIVNLKKDEHASAAYQAIHPKGLVPAMVEDGQLFIESIDIIQQIAGEQSQLANAASPELLTMADEAQLDLKLLTFEFLFRADPAPSKSDAEAFQSAHSNDWLKQFRIDFTNGFDTERIARAVLATQRGLQHLDQVLSDDREFLGGEIFSLSDIAWMPNVHRFNLMSWPYDRTPYLQRWFERVSSRPSYKSALLDWQKEGVADVYSDYTRKRSAEGTCVRRYFG